MIRLGTCEKVCFTFVLRKMFSIRTPFLQCNGTVKINNNLFDFLIGALFKKKNYMKGTHFECQMQVISSKDLNARTIESRLEQVIAQTQLVKTQNRRRH